MFQKPWSFASYCSPVRNPPGTLHRPDPEPVGPDVLQTYVVAVLRPGVHNARGEIRQCQLPSAQRMLVVALRLYVLIRCSIDRAGANARLSTDLSTHC